MPQLNDIREYARKASFIRGSDARQLIQHIDDLSNSLRIMLQTYWAKNADGTFGDGGEPPAVITTSYAVLDEKPQ